MANSLGNNIYTEDNFLISVGYSVQNNLTTGEVQKGYYVYVMNLTDHKYEFVCDKETVRMFSSDKVALEEGFHLYKYKYAT